MGLRIIDRQFQIRNGADISDAERQSSLELEARRWAASRGAGPMADPTAFVDHFQQVKARLASPTRMAEMATRIRADILGHNDSALSHNKVDIATLLELL